MVASSPPGSPLLRRMVILTVNGTNCVSDPALHALSRGYPKQEAGAVSHLPAQVSTLVTQSSEDVKVVREFLRHANSRVTLDLYAPARFAGEAGRTKQICQTGVQPKERQWPNWTMP